MVYLIGVDHIQDVIDSLGYAWADQALLEVVNRFREKLKPDQYLCRIEGTQFVLVSTENDVSNITQIADELRNVVSKPIMIDDKPFPLTLSIGISYDVGKTAITYSPLLTMQWIIFARMAVTAGSSSARR